MEEANKIILSISDGRGKGVFWWEPAAPNKGFTSRTFFDDNGNVLRLINVFDKYVRH